MAEAAVFRRLLWEYPAMLLPSSQTLGDGDGADTPEGEQLSQSWQQRFAESSAGGGRHRVRRPRFILAERERISAVNRIGPIPSCRFDLTKDLTDGKSWQRRHSTVMAGYLRKRAVRCSDWLHCPFLPALWGRLLNQPDMSAGSCLLLALPAGGLPPLAKDLKGHRHCTESLMSRQGLPVSYW